MAHLTFGRASDSYILTAPLFLRDEPGCLGRCSLTLIRRTLASSRSCFTAFCATAKLPLALLFDMTATVDGQSSGEAQSRKFCVRKSDTVVPASRLLQAQRWRVYSLPTPESHIYNFTITFTFCTYTLRVHYIATISNRLLVETVTGAIDS